MNNTPFFVGYLPMPAALKKFYVPLAAVLIIAAGVAGYFWASGQKSTGPAHWHVGAPTVMTGIVTVKPYPALHRIKPGSAGEVESVLLVAQGKYAADAVAAAFDGRAVAVRGAEIRRGNWLMLEIGDDAFSDINNAADIAAVTAADAQKIVAALRVQRLEPITLRGEIADSKCYLGVMKPGRGGIHKACAEVCLRGGIPPMLVVAGLGGRQFGYLLAHGGGSAAEMLAQYAGELVEIRGQAHLRGDLAFITVADDGVRRQ